MNYNQALEYIHSTLWRGSRLGLARIQDLTSKMGNPENSLRFVHIAGTNGKGSTAAILAAVFKEAGYKTGLFTSPYVTKFTERIQINFSPISENDLAMETEYVKAFAENMDDKPTEFELVTAIALSYFKRQECDIVIFEVGMGGELDSTNVIDCPEVAVITSIGYDHIEQLGNSIEEIAKAKAGIIKEGCTVVAYPGEEASNEVIRKIAKEKNAEIEFADFSRLTPLGTENGFQHFDFAPYKNIQLSLLGDYQLKNASVAITVIEALKNKGWDISKEKLFAGLKKAKWPGRFELLLNSPVFLLDGGHNPNGTTAAADSLKKMFPNDKFIFITGVMADKDIQGLFSPLIPISHRFITVTPDNPRAMDAGNLAEILNDLGGNARSANSYENAINAALDISDGIIPICAIGSLYMAGAIRELVLKLTP